MQYFRVTVTHFWLNDFGESHLHPAVKVLVSILNEIRPRKPFGYHFIVRYNNGMLIIFENASERLMQTVYSHYSDICETQYHVPWHQIKKRTSLRYENHELICIKKGGPSHLHPIRGHTQTSFTFTLTPIGAI